jgi:hypothetical protein
MCMQLLDGQDIILSNCICHFLNATLAAPQLMPLYAQSFTFQIEDTIFIALGERCNIPINGICPSTYYSLILYPKNKIALHRSITIRVESESYSHLLNFDLIQGKERRRGETNLRNWSPNPIPSPSCP